jgi:tetratricopeptide (TPR) repeat protein/uncharacterized caspase-like protein
MVKIKSLILSIVVIAFALSAVRMAQSQTAAQNVSGERTFAVVIGISKYPRLPGGYQLQFAERDATMFAETLTNSGANPDNVRLLVGPNATAANIRTALGTWLARSASASDSVYIFFSGHGLVESEFKESYLLAYDSSPGDPYATAISIGELGRAVGRRLRARQVLILADAARRDFFNPDSDGASTTKLFIESFGEISASRPGVAVMLASGPGEFSREGQRWGGGVFTKYAVASLSGAGDGDGDGLITGTEFFDFVFKHVADDTSSKQHPWLAATSLASIAIAKTPRPTTIAAAPSGRTTPAQPEQRPVAKKTEPERDQPPKAQQPAELDRQKTSGAEPVSGRTTDAPRMTPAAEPTRPAGPGTDSINSKGRTKDTPTTPSPSVEGGAATRTASGKGTAKSTSRGSKAPVRSTAGNKTAPSSRTPAATSDPKKQGSSPVVASSTPQEVNAIQPATTTESKTESAPAPPRTVISPPAVPALSTDPVRAGTPAVTGSIGVTSAESAPSPLILLLERAISSGDLIEPRDSSAWDYYQKLSRDSASTSEASRLKPLLAAALLKSGRTLVAGDVRADNIAGKVDDFRRGGQMLARARALAPENTESAGFEKLSAAEALVGLQFYDEAEKALTQLQSLRSAAVENALGLSYLGSLNEWQAERAFKRAIELDSSWASPHYNLAILYRSQKKEATGELELAAALAPSNTFVLSTLADEYFNKEKWGPAADTYRKAVAVKPNDETLHTKLGHALYSQGLRDEANKEYQKAKELRGRQ